MKNKFLLLGATAILSMSAMTTNVAAAVSNVEKDINVHVRILRGNGANVIQDIDFGSFFVTGNSETINMEPATGRVYYEAGELEHYNESSGAQGDLLTTAKNGIIEYVSDTADFGDANVASVSLPASVTLNHTDGKSGVVTFVPASSMIRTESNINHYGEIFGIGGTLSVVNASAGDYEATFTVTFVIGHDI